MRCLSSCLRSVNFSVRKTFPSDINRSNEKKQGSPRSKQEVTALRFSTLIQTHDFAVQNSLAYIWRFQLFAKRFK